MHIIIASEYHYSSFKGGNEQHAHQLALGLVELGHQVTYISTSNLAAKKLPYLHMQLPHLRLVNYLFLSRIPKSIHLSLMDASVLHVFGFSPLLLQLLTCFNHTFPTVVSYQADTLPKHRLTKLMSRAYHRLLPWVTDGVIVSTKRYQLLLQKRWPQLCVRHIPLMVPRHIIDGLTDKSQARKLLMLDHTARHVLCVAALSTHHYYKGIEVLLAAAEQLPPQIHIHVVGGGDRLAHYQKLALSMNLAEKVTFHGSVANAHMASWYRAVDLCVLPSLSASEGFGLCLLEAMYCGTPCLTTTAIGPAGEYKKLGLCHLSEPNNPQALAHAIDSILTQGDAAMVERAKHWADTHTPTAMTQKTLSLYTSLLSQRRS